MSELQSSRDGVAIVGMACRLPGAHDPDSLWRNVRDRVCSISRFDDHELRAAGVDETLLRDPDYVPAGGIIGNIE
ncbi:MAG: beta-ketoacyl synthase N-terminal-like domain-containing protein, partial [Myxococcota bacterium]